MADTRLTAVVSETLSPVTGALTQATNAPRGAVGVELRGTGASPPVWQFTPRIRRAYHFDASASSYIDHTAAITERGTTNFAEIDSFDASPADQFYIGCDVPFRGLYVNIKAANGTASVATWEYDVAGTWTDISDTDATASGGATLAVDDIVSWTVPTDWTKGTVNGAGPLYWVRMNVSADLDSDTQVAEFIPLSVQSNGPSAEVHDITTTGRGSMPRFWFNPDDIGGIEAVGDNADTLVVNWLIARQNTTFVAE